MGVAALLTATGLLFIIYFSYNASQEDGGTDVGEFIKLSGILVLLSLFFFVFMAVSFLVIQALAYLIILLLALFKNNIFTMKMSCFISLLLINVGGAYMLWEQIKEKSEQKKFMEESGSTAAPAPAETVKETKDESEEEKGGEETGAEKSDAEAEYELSKIGISQRVAKILSEADINTVEQVTSLTEQELSDTKNIGEKSLEEIKNALKENGQALKED